MKPESSRSSSAEAFVVGVNFITGLSISSVLSQSMQGLKSDMNQENIPAVIKIPTANNEEEEFSFGAKKEEDPIKETNPEEEESEEDILTFWWNLDKKIAFKA